jgi:hypothetical protein
MGELTRSGRDVHRVPAVVVSGNPVTGRTPSYHSSANTFDSASLAVAAISHWAALARVAASADNRGATPV